MIKKPYHIGTKRQIAAFTNPTRSDIFLRIATLGPLSVRQIAEGLELPVTSLYHHLQYLLRAGLIAPLHEAASGKAGGRPAVVYEAIARVIVLSKEIDKPGHADLVGKTARLAAAQASRDFNAGIRDKASQLEGGQKNIAFFRTLFSPSPPKLKRINALLDELREITSTAHDKNGQLMTIAWFTSPVLRKKKKPSKRK